ncbi:MAG: hypothetical protein WCK41_03005 [Actinomycetes bacterium]
MSARREVLEFTTDNLEPALSEMVAIARARDGWVNIRPRPVENPAEFMTEFASDPVASPLGLFGRRKPITLEGTWVPGRSTRNGTDPDSVGLEHPAGRFGVRQLRDGGSPVPKAWKVVTDSTRRGLVLRVPPSDDIENNCRTILSWLLTAATTLAPIQVNGRWQVEVNRR